MPPTRQSLETFFGTPADGALLSDLDLAAIPRHVAVIMDGNGRWAAKRGLPRIFGHKAGAEAIKESIAASVELGIEFLTIYSFSSENWRRSAEEVSGLMNLFIEVLEAELDHLMEWGVCVKVIGSEQGMPAKTMAAFRRTEERTAGNERLTLLVALNYGGRAEIVDAARALAAEAARGDIDPDAITEETFQQRLYTAGIPDPDLLIRTSGEMRISNFLLWQIAYAELCVTPVLWPDFDRGDLLRAVMEFQSRVRRFGGN